ncbi:hypothetical protein C8A05DRAFT_14584 [Staphylotrichum tortipilum]|uniref:Uncharacterized protein n=1 Tax=Staphylotrichum tortipilum TaxID=2831512 RepID=A0AAN6RUG9_9PEZI|nr:hypothetical protein C8A05DRAFT_14584 [Staphylotrichum longicolle]
MGTRHLICVFWKGKWYLAQYGQFDGYPEGQGAKLFKFLSVARNIDNLKGGLEHHVYEPTAEQLEAIWVECDAWDAARSADPATFNVWERNMHGINQLYPSLARETSAGVLGLIARAARSEEPAKEATEPKKIPLQLDLGFANDSLFCEWAYVVDLDKEVLEVYGGHEAKGEGHRFADVGGPTVPVPRLVCSYDFAELFLTKSKTEFLEKVLAACKEPEEEEEEGDGREPTSTGVPPGYDTDDEEEDDEEEGEKNGDEDADKADTAHEADLAEGGSAKGSL